MAKGFQKQQDIDFFETLNSVVKPFTIRVILTIAVTYDWDIQQININNAFLNDTLKESLHGTAWRLHQCLSSLSCL